MELASEVAGQLLTVTVTTEGTALISGTAELSTGELELTLEGTAELLTTGTTELTTGTTELTEGAAELDTTGTTELTMELLAASVVLEATATGVLIEALDTTPAVVVGTAVVETLMAVVLVRAGQSVTEAAQAGGSGSQQNAAKHAVRGTAQTYSRW